MVRSLWTGATGMNAQQTNVDTIANNLANVNTNGYKTQVAEFKTLLYQTLQTKTTTANGDTKPTSSQVGLGTRVSSINSVFTQGALLASESDTAFAIEGDGFFAVRCGDGQTRYTRNGDFNWSLGTGNTIVLCSSEGYPVLDETGKPISLANTYIVNKITVDASGDLLYPDANNVPQRLGITIGKFQFQNPAGMERYGDTLFTVTPVSGAAINEATSNAVAKSRVVQGYLEGSNVSVADEMVNLIVAQRAYEMNSKVITTTDTMMEQANNLKR